MPKKGEMVGVLLELRKRELVEEYFGNSFLVFILVPP